MSGCCASRAAMRADLVIGPGGSPWRQTQAYRPAGSTPNSAPCDAHEHDVGRLTHYDVLGAHLKNVPIRGGQSDDRAPAHRRCLRPGRRSAETAAAVDDQTLAGDEAGCFRGEEADRVR